MIQIYRYTCAYLRTPLGSRLTTRWGVLTPLNLHIQILELGASGFSQLLTRVVQWRHGISGRPSRILFFQDPCSSLEFSFCHSWASFVLFLIIYLFVFSHLRLSVM